MSNKYQIFIYSLVLFISLGACTELLEEDPKDQVFIENFFQSENDAISAVNSIYSILNATSSPPTFGGLYHSSYWIVSGLASDEMENRQVGAVELDQLQNFNHTPVNATVYDIWRHAYKGISNANFALEGIPLIDMDVGLQNRLLGEAYFLRSLLYFELVRMFGDVPLLLNFESEITPSRSSASQVYAKIIEDLGFALGALPASYDKGNGLGRATRYAAHALLAKVYLTTGDYQNASANCVAIINSNNFDLWQDYKEAFALDNENGKEDIFTIGFGTANNSISFWEVGQFNVRLLPRELSGQIPGINAQGWQVATQDLYESFESQDRRREVSLLTTVHNLNGTTTTVEPHIRKYWDEIAEPSGGNTDHDLSYFRYSDVLLMYAEAQNELGGGPNQDAYEAINSVRKRARFNGTTELPILADLNNLSYDEFKNALLQERRWEFAGEGQRWFDLVRFGKLETQVPLAKPGVQPQNFHNLFPIPQEEIDLNQNLLPQNQGY